MTKYKRHSTDYELEKRQLEAFVKTHLTECFLFLMGLDSEDDQYDKLDKFDSFLYEICRGDTEQFKDLHEQMLADCELGCDGESLNPNAKLSGVDWVSLAITYANPLTEDIKSWLAARQKKTGQLLGDKIIEEPFLFRTQSILERGAVRTMELMISNGETK